MDRREFLKLVVAATAAALLPEIRIGTESPAPPSALATAYTKIGHEFNHVDDLIVRMYEQGNVVIAEVSRLFNVREACGIKDAWADAVHGQDATLRGLWERRDLIIRALTNDPLPPDVVAKDPNFVPLGKDREELRVVTMHLQGGLDTGPRGSFLAGDSDDWGL